MLAINRYGTGATAGRRGRLYGVLFVLLLAPGLWPSGAVAHGVDHRIERGEAVMVYFSSDHDEAMAGAGFRVFSPDGREVFSSGRTDALGRAVFAPNRPGNWRVLMATEDGHGAEVEVLVAGSAEEETSATAADPHPPLVGRVSATAAGIGYLFGIAGLLALWRLRR